MHILITIAGAALVVVILWDAFEAVVLPRNVSRRMRLSRLYFRYTWRPWAAISTRIGERRRDRYLAIYGPLSLLSLTIVWALGLMLGFGILQWGTGSELRAGSMPARFVDDLYMSGTTFTTLGLGDVVPSGGVGRLLAVIEAGIGFGFLAIVITYFPVLYQSFSRREVRLTLLDAWAGSPPAAAEVLRRLARAGDLGAIDPFLRDWEYWCSEVLESHISYPAVAYFRSQHSRQSWVAALTTMLDLSALVEAGMDEIPSWQAHVTFAIARHAAVDLTQVLNAEPIDDAMRLSDEDLEGMRRQLETAGLKPDRSIEATARLEDLRRSYEPYVAGLSQLLRMPLPAWWRERSVKDNWEINPRRSGTHL